VSAKDHPNNAPGVPMKFPPAVERLQIKYMNPNWVKNVLAAAVRLCSL